jgi:hypothetical protein
MPDVARREEDSMRVVGGNGFYQTTQCYNPEDSLPN